MCSYVELMCMHDCMLSRPRACLVLVTWYIWRDVGAECLKERSSRFSRNLLLKHLLERKQTVISWIRRADQRPKPKPLYFESPWRMSGRTVLPSKLMTGSQPVSLFGVEWRVIRGGPACSGRTKRPRNSSEGLFRGKNATYSSSDSLPREDGSLSSKVFRTILIMDPWAMTL